MIEQVEITLKPKSRGFHLVTSEVLSQLPKLPKTGIMNIFCKHTSCGLSINENADIDVRIDMETIFNRLVPEMTNEREKSGACINSSERGGFRQSQNQPEYLHTLEGADDMPAHAKSTLSGVSLTIPITNGHLNMGTWQGIYLCEYRNYGGARKLVVTIIGEPHC
ncbi:MAG: YjbQ family protein [Prevotella sp.]|nr:YjbQ family protein [Prevotella sp.]